MQILYFNKCRQQQYYYLYPNSKSGVISVNHGSSFKTPNGCVFVNGFVDFLFQFELREGTLHPFPFIEHKYTTLLLPNP